MLEGPNLVAAAVAAGVQLETLFALPDDEDAARWAGASGAELVLVTADVLDRVATTQAPQSPIAVFAPLQRDRSDGHALVLWDVTDPGNVGALVRTAAAFGADVIATPGTTDMWAPKVLRSGAGAHFSTTIEERSHLDVSTLKSEGYQVAATVVGGGVPVSEVTVEERTALLIGSESHGLAAEVVAAADVRVTIPTAGTESLNAAVAGSIVAFVLFRQQ